jgi:hypothetical protein
MNRGKTRNTAIIVVITVVVIGFAFAVFRPQAGPANGALDDFAKCLAAKGATMYGAYWCPHCQNEKAAFGDSFHYVNYVECTQETQKCEAAGIQGFPTWVFPDASTGSAQGGRRFEGEQGLKKLSEESGCVLPASPK